MLIDDYKIWLAQHMGSGREYVGFAEYQKMLDAGELPLSASEKTPSRGLGDTIAKMTSAIGIVPCGACKKRQEILNKLVPYE